MAHSSTSNCTINIDLVFKLEYYKMPKYQLNDKIEMKPGSR